MSWSDVPWSLVIVVAIAIWLALKIHVVKHNERVAVHVLGQYLKLIGPGLMIKWSGGEVVWQRLALGDIGTWVGDGKVQFGDQVVPVTCSASLAHGARIEKFEADAIVVEPTAIRGVRCEKCGHVTRTSA